MLSKRAVELATMKLGKAGPGKGPEHECGCKACNCAACKAKRAAAKGGAAGKATDDDDGFDLN